MFSTDARLVERRQVGRDLFVLGFAAPEVAEAALPGQFVNLLLRPGPLLRRPFSVYRTTDGRVEVLLRAVGVATAQLLSLAGGDRVSLLGEAGWRYLPWAAPRSTFDLRATARLHLGRFSLWAEAGRWPLATEGLAGISLFL